LYKASFCIRPADGILQWVCRISSVIEEVTLLPKQVKIFTSSIPGEFENQVNEFLDKLHSSNVIDAEYRTMPAVSTGDDSVTKPSGFFSMLVF
jgi:hypothetical protein